MVLVVVSSSSSAMAEWVEFTGSSDGTFSAHVNRSTIHLEDNKVKMSDLLNFKMVQTNLDAPYLSIEQQHEYDCKEELRRRLSITWYSDSMGGGKVVGTYSDLGKWEPVPANSFGNTLWKIACGKQ